MSLLNRIHYVRNYFHACETAKRGHHNTAVTIFESIISTRPCDWRPHIWLALSLSELGEYERAVTLARRAIALNPYAHTLPTFLARIHYDHGNYQEARQALQNSLIINPSYTLAAAYLNLIRLATGDFSAVRDLLTSRLGNIPFESRLLTLCETILLNEPTARSLDECLLEKERGNRPPLNPNTVLKPFSRLLFHVASIISHPFSYTRRQATLHYLAGTRFLSSGLPEPAAQEISKALELDPSSDHLRECLADALLLAERYADALPLLETLKKKESSCQELDLPIAIAHYYLGNYDIAYAHAQSALNQQNFSSFYICGLCALRLNQLFDARRWFERALVCANPNILDLRLAELTRLRTPPTPP